MLTEPVFLYVEDDALNRRVMEILLTRVLGYKHLTVFENSENFMERLKAMSPQPDIILLDIHMEPMDGFKMLDLLRQDEEYKHTTIVAVTASVMNEEVELLKTAGFNGGIAKPLDKSVFPEVLGQLMQGEEVWHIV